MPIEGFTYDAHTDLWVADGFGGLGWADGSEAYLQQVFEGAEIISDYPLELAGAIRDWPSRYHLSHLRTNFLEAMRPLLDPSWKALELGGGAGAITKWLAQAVAQVDVLEGSPERARVNRLRARGDDNVNVLVGDMVAAPFPGVYDLATLVGVLEYTPAQPGKTRRQACLELLRKIRGSLGADGVLLVAIENRLGAKYWAGCGEDHTTRLFDGVLGYPDDTPITFSRAELEALLREAGFGSQQFYHLHPDYKLPTTVIREVEDLGVVAPHQWTQGFAEDYMGTREYLLPDPLLMKSVEDAGLFWQYTNSFLVLCSPSADAVLAEDWLIKKFSNSTRPELHHTITLVEREGALRVERAPLRSGQARADLGDYEYALRDGEYVAGSLVVMEAYSALVSQHWFEGLSGLCRELLQEARARFGVAAPPAPEAPRAQAPYDMLDGAALDFTLWNVIRGADGSLSFIDTKWTSKQRIPTDYLLFRSLFVVLSAGSAFVPVDLREALTSILQQFYPAFDEARLAEHLEAEMRLQECVHADDLSRLHLDAEGRLPIAQTGGSTLVKLRQLTAALATTDAWLREAQAENEALRPALAAERAEVAQLRPELAVMRADLAVMRADLAANAAQLADMYASTSWRVSAPVRVAGRQAAELSRRARHSRVRREAGKLARSWAPGLMERRDRRLAAPQPAGGRPDGPSDDPLLLAAEARKLEYRPMISVLVPVYDTAPQYLRLAVDSVLEQAYPEWELILCDDGSTKAETKAALEEIARLDARIRVHSLAANSGIAAATNAALALAQGEFVAMLDHDDELLPAALLEVVKALNADRTLDVVYTDQDYVEADGSVAQTFYKPDWSLELFRGVMYVGHLLVVRRALADEIGGFDTAFDNVQDFEFMLRLAEHTERIAHVPRILYHWRKIPGSVAFGGNEKRDIEPLQAAAVNAHLGRCGVAAFARSNPDHAHRLLIAPAPRSAYPLASVVLRAAGVEAHLEACIASILAAGSYPRREIIVCGGDISGDRAQRLEALGAVLVAPGESGAAAALAGLEQAGGDLIVSLVGDLEVLTPDWLEHLLLGCELPGVACVAPLILAADGTVAGAGLIVGGGGVVGPAMQGRQPGTDGYAGSLSCAREVSAVSGDCYALARPVLAVLGALSPYYASDQYQAVDLSLRACAKGLRNLCTPRVVVRRRGAALRDAARDGWRDAPAAPDALDALLLADAWEPLLAKGDPFHNRNFAQAVPGYEA